MTNQPDDAAVEDPLFLSDTASVTREWRLCAHYVNKAGEKVAFWGEWQAYTSQDQPRARLLELKPVWHLWTVCIEFDNGKVLRPEDLSPDP